MASEHIWQNQMSYHDFIEVDFENYVQTIRNYGTNGNHTTLIAIATVLPGKRDSDFMFCLQSYRGLIIDRSHVY